MRNEASRMQWGHETIGSVTSEFYSAFTNSGGPAPVDILYGVCLPEAVIVNASSETPVVYTLREFVEPRRTLLASGTLAGFKEYEVSEVTEVDDRIAQRVSRYEKSWVERGLQMHGAGTKIFSFVLTAKGWKIASVLWRDAGPGVVQT